MTTVDATAAGVLFRVKGTRIVDPRWTILTSGKNNGKRDRNTDEQTLPVFE